jgi:type IX secretion system PorP/SprF family membrane protein
MPVVLQPSFLLKGSGNIVQFDLNLTALVRDRYWGGLSYRFQDAVVVLGGVELANGVRIGYSYDITTSPLAKVSGGSHEVVVGYTFDLNLDKREKRYKSVRFL